MKILKSAEDYLEQILILQMKNGSVHSIDIAEALEFSKPSVSVAMKKLRENGYISMEKNGAIVLLEPGRIIAEHIYERHKTLTDFFVLLGVEESIAAEDACRVEHEISPETFQAIKAALEKQKG